jgi:hypothetical protein
MLYIITILVAFKAQRHFWINWALFSVFFTAITVVFGGMILMNGGYSYDVTRQIMLIEVVVSFAKTLCIFAATRGVLVLFKRDYWKETSS